MSAGLGADPAAAGLWRGRRLARDRPGVSPRPRRSYWLPPDPPLPPADEEPPVPRCRRCHYRADSRAERVLRARDGAFVKVVTASENAFTPAL